MKMVPEASEREQGENIKKLLVNKHPYPNLPLLAPPPPFFSVQVLATMRLKRELILTAKV